MSPSSFQRARRPEHKTQRREAILAAASTLATRDGVRTVTLTDIAAAIPIHKSALLRYFETREQIFLEVAGRQWREWSRATSAALAQLAPGGVPAAAAVLADSFASRPLLCDLIPHTALNLERNVSREAVRSYKLTSLGAVDAVAAALAGPIPGLDDDARGEILAAVALLAGGMWQIATPPPALADVYADEPDLRRTGPAYAQRLTRVAEAIIRGFDACTADAEG